jgi:hypothetical protein
MTDAMTDPSPTIDDYDTGAVRNRGVLLDGQMHGQWEMT